MNRVARSDYHEIPASLPMRVAKPGLLVWLPCPGTLMIFHSPGFLKMWWLRLIRFNDEPRSCSGVNP